MCPAGVQYGDLLEQWRDHQWQGRNRPLRARLLMAVVARPWLLRLQGFVRRYARTKASNRAYSLMLGCVERGLYPRVSRAVLRLAPGVQAPSAQGCCGALHAHNGSSAKGAEMAESLGKHLTGTIVTTAGGCAAHLAAHLGRDRVKEFSEWLVEMGAWPAGEVLVNGRRARVALQDSCHLRNGMGVTGQPRELIKAVADYVELPGAGGCCGAAGTYSLLRGRDSRKVLAPKLREIEAAGVDFVVAVNPGCLRQLQQGLRRSGSPVKAVHLAELLVQARE